MHNSIILYSNSAAFADPIRLGIDVSCDVLHVIFTSCLEVATKSVHAGSQLKPRRAYRATASLPPYRWFTELSRVRPEIAVRKCSILYRLLIANYTAHALPSVKLLACYPRQNLKETRLPIDQRSWSVRSINRNKLQDSWTKEGNATIGVRWPWRESHRGAPARQSALK